ncbi:MAG TPA: hypothetical protein VKU19_18480 [Bryobacteraceae bacterium]|nr:hypothetical protein [Bryobacteraceae bacterium]
MNKLLSIVLTVILGACCVLAQGGAKTESARIDGKWQMSLDTPHGPMKGPLQIQQDGEKLKGTYELEMFGSMTLNGKVEGDKISFNMEVPGAGITLAFTGTVAGEKMTGDTDHAGKWSAVRQ